MFEKGNKDAEKYNEKEAHKLLDRSIELANEVEDGAYKFDFIGEVARELGTYHHIYRHLIKRFPELKGKFELLKSTLEANCYSNTKKGKIREATGIVNLKSNHKWTDRQEINQEIKMPSVTIVKHGDKPNEEAK